MEISGFDEARALKWLKHYRRRLRKDNEIVERSARSFKRETLYRDERMAHIIEFMWKSHRESQQ